MFSNAIDSEGLVARRDIERSVTRLYAMLIRAGYFDSNATEYRHLGWSDVLSSNAQNLSYEVRLAETNSTITWTLIPHP